MSILELLSAFRGTWDAFGWGISPELARIFASHPHHRVADVPPEAYIDFGDLQARVLILEFSGIDPHTVEVDPKEAYSLFASHFFTDFFS